MVLVGGVFFGWFGCFVVWCFDCLILRGVGLGFSGYVGWVF